VHVCYNLPYMQSLQEYVSEARSKGQAIGHFNACTVEMVWGIFRAAQKLSVPVIVGFSEGERDFFGVRQAALFVRSLREQYTYPIFSNADHTYSLQRVKEAVDALYDAVIFDGAELSFDENLKITKQCVEYARAHQSGTLVEGELGFIGKSSSVRAELPAGVHISEAYLTKPEEAARFVKETGVDFLAPAVGNVHGMLANGHDPSLHIARVKAIRDAVAVPLVLHGASGNSAEDIAVACQAGVGIVHISTELRVAYRRALQVSLQSDPDQVAPYKYLKPVVAAVEKIVEEKLAIVNKKL